MHKKNKEISRAFQVALFKAFDDEGTISAHEEEIGKLYRLVGKGNNFFEHKIISIEFTEKQGKELIAYIADKLGSTGGIISLRTSGRYQDWVDEKYFKRYGEAVKEDKKEKVKEEKKEDEKEANNNEEYRLHKSVNISYDARLVDATYIRDFIDESIKKAKEENKSSIKLNIMPFLLFFFMQFKNIVSKIKE